MGNFQLLNRKKLVMMTGCLFFISKIFPQLKKCFVTCNLMMSYFQYFLKIKNISFYDYMSRLLQLLCIFWAFLLVLD